MVRKKEKTKKTGEKVCETFEIGDKEKTFCGSIGDEKPTKKQLDSEEKTLKYVLAGIGIFILVFALGFYINYSMKNFTLDGIKYDIMTEKEVKFYHATIPIKDDKGRLVTNFNMYLRKDPRETVKNVKFEGGAFWSGVVVLDSTGEDFNCNGDGVISIANMQQIINQFQSKMIKDPEAGCDAEGRYTYIKLQTANETSIEQVGPKCYNFNINNCEIMDVTERFMIDIAERAGK